MSNLRCSLFSPDYLISTSASIQYVNFITLFSSFAVIVTDFQRGTEAHTTPYRKTTEFVRSTATPSTSTWQQGSNRFQSNNSQTGRQSVVRNSGKQIKKTFLEIKLDSWRARAKAILKKNWINFFFLFYIIT